MDRICRRKLWRLRGLIIFLPPVARLSGCHPARVCSLSPIVAKVVVVAAMDRLCSIFPHLHPSQRTQRRLLADTPLASRLSPLAVLTTMASPQNIYQILTKYLLLAIASACVHGLKVRELRQVRVTDESNHPCLLTRQVTARGEHLCMKAIHRIFNLSHPLCAVSTSGTFSTIQLVESDDSRH